MLGRAHAATQVAQQVVSSPADSDPSSRVRCSVEAKGPEVIGVADHPSDEVVLRLGRKSAELLHDLLWIVGEHWSAGMSIPAPDADTKTHLGSAYREIESALGRMNDTEAMRRELERTAGERHEKR